MSEDGSALARDARSYRQGLVLGLTMAEVFLLLVFALLIALTAMWQKERNLRIAVEKGVPSAKSNLAPLLVAAIDVAGEKKVVDALDVLRNGGQIDSVKPSEAVALNGLRRRWRSFAATKIDEDWQVLAKAMDLSTADLDEALNTGSVVKSTLPKSEDRRRLGNLLKSGLDAERKTADAKAAPVSDEKIPGHQWPPIINLSDAKGYSFDRGKANLTIDFKKLLADRVVPDLIKLTKQYDVSVIEVVGHTDETKMGSRVSNMDIFLFDVLQNRAKVDVLAPGDNAGLGLARALAVVRELKEDDRLKQFTILPLSGGQLIDTQDRMADGSGGDVAGRRRIEIRMRRPSSQ